jgi:endonuclease/exonuclease/phosphatase family metal-dependent hydrolase
VLWEPEAVRIVTWNLNQGMAAAIWPRLQASLAADLVLLQESPRPSWPRPCDWQPVPHAEWGSAVLATHGTIRPIPIAGYEGWVAGGELVNSPLAAAGRSLFAFSLHSPTPNTNRPRQGYVAEAVCIVETIYQQLPAGADVVIGGDFNFTSLGQRHEDEPIQTKKQEQAALTRFADLGLVSCWLCAHPGRPLAQTLRWSSDRAPGRTTPYHCDGIWVPQRWRENIVCEVLTSQLTEASDHFPMVAWISPTRFPSANQEST